jgi:hypothetical protein
MKNFLFEDIYLLSNADQRGRRVSFHPKKNLIVGRNHTGKSTIIKNLFVTLGARPQGELQQWDDAAATVVTFSLDGVQLRVAHQSGSRALFAEDGKLIHASSNHQDWTAKLAEVLGFNLVLTDKNQQTVSADARCFFLPFYINQDGSWLAGWDTFVGMQQYRQPVGAILDYFGGIKPPAYYELDSKRVVASRQLEELHKEERVLERTRERLSKTLSMSGTKVDPKNFEADIVNLTVAVTELNKKQETLRDTSVREQESLASMQLQVRLAEDALATYDKDAVYLRTDARELLACPTCGAEHKESFIELLGYAEDARILRELVARLHHDTVKVAEQVRKTRSQLSELEVNYGKVASVLEARRGELKFSEVVADMGAERAFRAFEDEITVLKSSIGKTLEELNVINQKLKALKDPKRSKAILKLFREAYASALRGLNLPAMDVKGIKLSSRPGLSGSGGPRSLLAYYAALWQTFRSEYGSFNIPLIVDAPQQQGQDDINLPAVVRYIANDLPTDAQIIVGIEKDLEEPFDKKILLDKPYRLLEEAQYSDVRDYVEPLVAEMYAALRRKSQIPLT